MFLLALLIWYGVQLLVLLLACGFVIGGGFVAAASAINAWRPPAGPSPAAARSWMLLCGVGLLAVILGVSGLTLAGPIIDPPFP